MASKKLSVSVVIPNYNGAKLLSENVPSIIEACKDCEEIIVVDDASSDQSVALLQKDFPSVTIIRNKNNLRFAISCNTGVAQAQGSIVVLLNTDVVPRKDFLKPLVAPFKDPTVFAVGAAEISDKNKPDTVSGRSCGHFSRGFLVHKKCKQQISGNTLWVAGGSGAFRKDVWLQLGGLDPLFAPAYDEDRDLCYRALKRGYTCRFADKSLVFHDHETTNTQVFTKKNIETMGYRNQLLFTWKNTTDIQLILQHVVWLPYHLIFTTLRSRGLFAKGFLQALNKLPAVLSRRTTEKRQSSITDQQIISQIHET